MHPLAVNPPEPLSQREEKLLSELEDVIETNMKGFVLVGMALTKIRDQRLYRIQYSTFEEYLLRVWDMARSTAYKLIEAAEVHGNLKQFFEGFVDLQEISVPENVAPWGTNRYPNAGKIEDILPKNERQARPLTLFPPEEQQAIWLSVLDEASNRQCQITANFIIQVILERQRKAIDDRVRKHADRAKKAPYLPPLVQSTYIALLQVVQNQNNEDWKSLGKPTMISMLEDLLADLKNF